MTDQATAAKPFATKLVVLGCGALALTACVGLATLCVALGFQVQRQTEEHLAGARAAAAERRWVDAGHLADEVLRIAPNHPEATRLRADASAHLSGLLQTLRCDRAAAINTLAFSPDGALLACASGEDVARIWDVQTGRPVHTLGHSNFVAALAYSPDGQLLATAAHSTGIREPTIRLWKSTSGTAVLGFGGGAAEGAADGRELVDGPALAFSPDGRLIASGNITGSISLWDSTSARRIRCKRPAKCVLTPAREAAT
jgi:hypothetical protein